MRQVRWFAAVALGVLAGLVRIAGATVGGAAVSGNDRTNHHSFVFLG